MMNNKFKIRIGKLIVFISILFFIIDAIYRISNNISYANREECIINRLMPSYLVAVFENFIELFLLIVIGIFVAVILEKYIKKFSRYYPNNIFSAFLYGSLLPICACGVIPLLYTLKDKVRMRNLIVFVMAAPLLSPYIIVLSFSVLGISYGILRILASFLLAVFCGFVVEYFYLKYGRNKEINNGSNLFKKCEECSQNSISDNIFLRTYEILTNITPFFLIAAILGTLATIYLPENIMFFNGKSNTILGYIAISAIGIPIYLCNGTEVLLLRPLMHNLGVSMGSAIAFSLASTSICITSIIMLLKFLGKRLTLILVVNILFFSVLMSIVIDYIISII